MFSLFDPSGRGLEIGPSYNPTKADGYNVETVDYADRDTLRTKYAETANVNIDRIEVVDHVTEGLRLVDMISKRGSYDYIVASHVIEHTPDLIGFLNDCATLLKGDGRLVLAVPDKHGCFDLLQPLSFVGHAIEAREAGRTRPNRTTVFNSIAYDVLRNGQIGWAHNERGNIEFASTLEAAMEISKLAHQKYVDVHVWRFVPSSFRLMIEDLFHLGMIAVREAGIIAGTGNEFFVALSRSGLGPALDRDTLARMILREAADIVASTPAPPITSRPMEAIPTNYTVMMRIAGLARAARRRVQISQWRKPFSN